ncbi:transglycosylase domain-containing protein [Cohnella hongkongensis]|uniref:PBP1A family penicillin-binding protein n=1 Tax=Cohnella hongkongensis TaxID=178337 RepID=A0ABV9F9U9_9BACL
MSHSTVSSRAGSMERSGRNGGKGKGNGNGKSKRPRKGKKKLFLVWLFFVALVALVCAVVGYLLVILNGERILNANINKLNLDKASIVVDRNGNEVAKLYNHEGNREFAPISEIPKLVQDAFIATEDKRYYEHNGVDLLGIGRALVKDIIARSAVEGASTITQQLAKNLFLNADKTLFRKGTEASIALALEQKMTKPEILELYLNRIYFGKGQYGIKTAAKYYFDVENLDDLELWQVATLAAMPKAPNTYNPIRNPEKSMERRAVVLKLMYDQGLISEQEKEAAGKVVYKPSKASQVDEKYLAFLDYVLDEAQEKTNLTEEELRSAGYKITTTLDTRAQSIAEKEFANDERFEKSVDEQKVQGAMVIMNQHDGSLVAMIGGRDYQAQGWNRAVKQRQPGSSFKPIIDYGPALDSGNFYPWSIVQDVKQCYGDYCPSNSNRNAYLGPIPMSQAIKESRNVSAVWLLNEIGIGKGLEFAKKLGIELGSEDRNLSIALGGLTNGVTPLQMARAYTAFANGGKLYEPHSVMKIEDVNGKTIYEFNAKPDQVMKESTSHYMTEMLAGVVQKGGTGTRAAISGRTVVGKTGTTQAGIPNLKTSKNRDVWFVGYTPELTAAVWFGYDKTDKDHLLDGSSGQAAAMFSAVMSQVLEKYEKKSFPVPTGVQEEEEEELLDPVSGLIVGYSPESVSVELMWSAVQGEGVSYRIYRKEASEAEFRLLADVADGTAYDDLAILPDMTYTYYVTAYQASKSLESPPSEQMTITVTSGMETPPPPEEGDGETVPPVETGEPLEPLEPLEPPIEVPGETPTPPLQTDENPPTTPVESPGQDLPPDGAISDDGIVPLTGLTP